jgi:undecaprenyl-diphosphatase
LDPSLATGEILWQAAVLGIVQGLTEFLPVSSTGHLILVPLLFGWKEGVLNRLEFDVALHIGTLVALVAVFWREWAMLIAAGFSSLWHRSLRDPEARLAWLILLATVPGAAAGILFQRQVETVLRSPIIIGSTMVGLGIILAIVDRAARAERDERSLGPLAALAVGIGQALALVPGVSRSGSTIAVGLCVGLNRAAAARFSFLLSTPIIVGAVAKEGIDVAHRGVASAEIPIAAVGVLAAGLSGYACIRWLLAYLRTRTLLPFVIYRVVIGSAVLALAAAGRFS